MTCSRLTARRSDFCYLPQEGMAHFLLRTGQVSRAVRHKTVEQIWYIISERGEMLRANEGHGDVSYISAGTCLTILLGIIFQFRPPSGRNR